MKKGEKKNKVIYDGSKYCAIGPCPVIEMIDGSEQMVRIYDPEKPQNGEYKMSVFEYNNIVKHAKPIKTKK